MPECQMEGCSNFAKGNYKHCAKCHFSKIVPKRRRRRRKNGFHRMILHAACSEKTTGVITATHSKTCGECNLLTDVGEEIIFVTICVDCARNRDPDSLVPQTESNFNDFCVVCKEVIPQTTPSPSTSEAILIETHTPKTENNTSHDEYQSQIPLTKMVKDLSRLLNGVVRIKRKNLIKRLIDECSYSKLDASYAVSNVLSTDAYEEEDGMLVLRKNRF